MHKLNKFVLVALLMLLPALFLNGCSRSEARSDKDDAFLPFAAYQYAKGEIQPRLPLPNSAVFALITEKDEVFIEELEGNRIEIKSVVGHRSSETSELVSSNFTIVLEYLGDGRFNTVSVEIK